MAKQGSAEHRAATSNGMRRSLKRRKSALSVSRRQLQAYRRAGLISESLRPIVLQAEDLAEAVVQDLGGESAVSAQEMTLILLAANELVIHLGSLNTYLRTENPDAATRATTAAQAIRSIYSTLGLKRREKELDLSAYLAQVDSTGGD